MDATHSNAWHVQAKAELTVNRSGQITGKSLTWEQTLLPNSVTLLELRKQ